MPMTEPSGLSDEQIDKITNRLLEVLDKEFHFHTTPLGVPQGKVDHIKLGMDDKFKPLLREWVSNATLSDIYNGF